ncbi:cyclic nucleotide-gated ion channel/potassium channel family protein [Pseudomonadota bacterium]|nr:cyclic nucleotide-gated ion channel/potassium channel family protein [Pseudomonadota bacterium]|tara:strand:+ start:337 stop:1365 length:1029 start_codon:yes stop_codon:yes gene_type:complete
MKNTLDFLNKFFGVVIALNIFHQIVSSAGYLSIESSLIQILYWVSIGVFGIEFLLRVFVERKLSFLISIDGFVLINQVFFPFYDLRILRLFRLFDIFSQSRFLLPTNTLIKTIIKQRNALLGSQIMVISILLVVSTFIYFLESSVQPDVFGSIPSTMWWGIATLTTVGYGDVVPMTDLGKLLASFTMLVGIGMFALPAAILASAYYEEIQKKNFLVSFEAIASVPLFQELPIGAVGKINEKLQVVLVSEHETIFSKGDEADSMFIIEYGKVKVEIQEPVYLVSGDYFGEMGLLGNAPRNATITAADDTKLLELTKSDLAELSEEHPGLFKELELSASSRSQN